MKKMYSRLLLLLFYAVVFISLQAQDYQLTFAIQGWNDVPDSVMVENFEQGTSLTLNGDDILQLNIGTTGFTDRIQKDNALKTYPNPMCSTGTIEFYNPHSGNVNIKLMDISGKILVQHNDILPQGNIFYTLNGLGNGAYFVSVELQNSTNSQVKQLSSVIISQMGSTNKPHIELQNIVEKNESINLKSTNKINDSIILMAYNDGETLIFTAWFQASTDIQEMVITENQAISFDLVETVTDIEGNIYLTIAIGEQLWMAENLGTTKYKDGTNIPNVLGNSQWENMTTPAYCWWNNDSVYADTNNFGALYNWFTVNTGILCPEGWHVPTNGEWENFVFYLAANGFNYDGTVYDGFDIDIAGSKVGKAIAATSNWLTPTYGNEWAIGKDMYLNNSSFFNGIGADGRYLYGGVFLDPYFLGNWWTSTSYDSDDSWTYFIYSEEPSIIKTWYFKAGGYSVRCLKDER